jgi:hypothetical protein
MPVGRYARHTLSILAQPEALRTTREVVIYAWDMQGAPSGETEATAVVYGVSPMWRFAGDADNSICMDVGVPDDRVPGTPLTLEAEYFMGAGAGGLGVMLLIRYGIFGRGESPTSLGSEVWRYLPKTPPASPLTDIAGPVTIPASEVDSKRAPVNMQVVFSRKATDPYDVDSNVLYLVKVVMRYTAYL